MSNPKKRKPRAARPAWSRRLRKCRACGTGNRSRPGGLCPRCHAQPDVRARFPPDRPKPIDFTGPAPPPARPTQTVPGTIEHEEELARRARAGERTTGPGDLYYRETEDERLERLAPPAAPRKPKAA